MKNRMGLTQASYWRVYFVQPAAPDDNRCVMLRGEQGETAGPMTIQDSEVWIDYFDNATYEKHRQERVVECTVRPMSRPAVMVVGNN